MRRSGSHPKSSRPRFDDRPRNGTGSELVELLHRIDGSAYGAYKRALGSWNFGAYRVDFTRVQADPYAPPSSIRVRYRRDQVDLSDTDLHSQDRQLATADFLARRAGDLIRQHAPALSIAPCGPEILERSSARVGSEDFELRIAVRLPARGRTVLGRQAAQIFTEQLPRVLRELFNFSDSAHREDWLAHVHALADHRALQQLLVERNLVGFIADGSRLARASGVSAQPLRSGVPFTAPASRRQQVELPHAGVVSGLAIPAGITVLEGGGFHGKSTVLTALEQGVYPHVPGDGRELVAALPSAMKVRAADGRPITRVDVSAFINHLPTGSSTTRFSTQNASGSTSQAASIIEAIQAGSQLLLFDEDTSATNLMIRDARMRTLVQADQEPITPLVDRIRSLPSERGVSVIMVTGGSADYLDAADLVLQMDAYRCLDATERAGEVMAAFPRQRTDLPDFPTPLPRSVVRVRPGGERSRTKTQGVDRIELDRQGVDVTDVEQIVDPGQTEAIAWIIRGVTEQLADGHRTLEQLVDEVLAGVEDRGLDALVDFGARPFPPFLARPRKVDICAGINRHRSLKIG